MQDFRIQLYQYQGQEFVKKKIKTIFSTENYKFHFSCTRNAIHVSKYVQLNNTLLLYCCLTFAYNFPLMWFRFLALYKNNQGFRKCFLSPNECRAQINSGSTYTYIHTYTHTNIQIYILSRVKVTLDGVSDWRLNLLPIYRS